MNDKISNYIKYCYRKILSIGNCVYSLSVGNFVEHKIIINCVYKFQQIHWENIVALVGKNT